MTSEQRMKEDWKARVCLIRTAPRIVERTRLEGRQGQAQSLEQGQAQGLEQGQAQGLEQGQAQREA